jgi:DNA-binding response OmpR family regulator
MRTAAPNGSSFLRSEILMPDHVLVVDDDCDHAESLAMILTTYGYQAEVVYNGEEALAAVSVRMPSLILLDMRMPRMNGWEFAREFATRYGRAAPIVVVSAAESARQRAAEISADGALPKPFDMQQLLDLVDRRVHRSAATPAQVPSSR